MSLGFGSNGVLAGSAAAAFQGWMYGAFTPAGGIFATLTSVAMLGTLMPAAALSGAATATMVATLVWAMGVGRSRTTDPGKNSRLFLGVGLSNWDEQSEKDVGYSVELKASSAQLMISVQV
ncbi:MAG: hypothetical protein M1821_009798 [Bathelium mastoideum]|nr:MAG: hypothetical protein M1821_009798 [Bathelium mastoideum]KAI9690445.1 MAG: hypothetical protein M1822_009408 [Bathelium mastoideum]